jgi:hypothetical protein
MSRVEEIEHAIGSSSPEEFRRVPRWILEKDQKARDSQMNTDSAKGALDFLFEEADQEARGSQLRPWPVVKRANG